MGKCVGKGDGNFLCGGGSRDVSETPEMAPDAGAGVVLCVCLGELCVVVVVWKRCHGLKEKWDVQLPPSPISLPWTDVVRSVCLSPSTSIHEALLSPNQPSSPTPTHTH